MNVDDPYVYCEVKNGDPLQDLYRLKFTTKRLARSEVRVSICVQEHHLMHVIETDLNNGLVHVPKFHRQVIDEIPGWIRGATCLVEGTLIGQQLVEQEQEAFNLRHEEVLKITYHCDPAVVFGQFVLTGWGPEEIKKDLSERDLANESRQVLQKDGSLVDGIRSRLQGFLR
jgi:hypothetical protein